MIRSVLFVCLGNICRSPTAEGVMRTMAAQAGLSLDIDSAGTGAWHVGKPPHAPAIRAAARRGYDLTGFRARQVGRADFTRFQLILAMDVANLRDLERLAPPGAPARLGRLLAHAPETGRSEVPDPYHSGDYEAVLDLIETACRGLVTRLAGASLP